MKQLLISPRLGTGKTNSKSKRKVYAPPVLNLGKMLQLPLSDLIPWTPTLTKILICCRMSKENPIVARKPEIHPKAKKKFAAFSDTEKKNY